jgi:serine/threonine protein kinase
MRRTQSIRHIHNPALARIHAAFIGAPMHPPMTVPNSAAPQCRYLVMEFVDGPSLLEWLEDNPGASLRERLRLLLTLAAGLDALHAGSSTVPPVAHGDVKPDNARLTPDGGIRLVDFGLLRAQGTTRAGPAMATLPYTAPEIFAAGENALPTSEADRFAFAATVFHVLTGVMPPLRADGRGPDLSALLPILERTPRIAGRPEVIATVMAGLVSDPVTRPTQLVPWLAAARRTETGVLNGFVDPDNGAEPTAVLAPGVPATTPDLSGRTAGPTPPSSSNPIGAFSADGPQQELRRRSTLGRLIAVAALKDHLRAERDLLRQITPDVPSRRTSWSWAKATP